MGQGRYGRINGASTRWLPYLIWNGLGNGHGARFILGLTCETMWTLSMARKYPNLKFVVVSPGNTRGTQAPNNLPPAMQFMLKY